jgi:predicted PurR-regulated permease PerM
MKLFVSWGATIANALMQFLIVLIVGVYFLADGERVYRWLLAFLPEVHRKKVAEASPEIATVVSSYMLGQLITSLLCGAYVFVILSVLKVPEPTVLAVIAGVFDILPLVGFFLSLIPALIVAFSVSTGTAGLVLVLYSVYHLVENYFIVPRVYGNRLRLSTLTVLVTCMAGALIAGVIGVIAVLPLVACYPIVERIWLKRHFEPDTVAKHEQIDAEEHPSK